MRYFYRIKSYHFIYCFNYRFILYMDDLSFEDFEVEYKYLKAAIEGGLEEKPENVLIYATSNRRHLIKETFSEREGSDDIHRNESIQEKISLAERFKNYKGSNIDDFEWNEPRGMEVW